MWRIVISIMFVHFKSPWKFIPKNDKSFFSKFFFSLWFSDWFKSPLLFSILSKYPFFEFKLFSGVIWVVIAGSLIVVVWEFLKIF